MRVYYLTGAQFALSNLALRRIKIARIEDINDPYELLGVDVRDKKLRAVIRKTKEQINKSRGLICFSKSWRNPLMWGHYAEKHTGMCLGFDVPEKKLFTVSYKKRLPEMEIDPETGRPTMEFMKQLLRRKFSDWKYEAEMRRFVKLDDHTVESGKYFCAFSKDLRLREIILGPRCELPIESVRKIIAGFKPPVAVLKSRIAYTHYGVREDEVASRTTPKG